MIFKHYIRYTQPAQAGFAMTAGGFSRPAWSGAGIPVLILNDHQARATVTLSDSGAGSEGSLTERSEPPLSRTQRHISGSIRETLHSGCASVQGASVVGSASVQGDRVSTDASLTLRQS